MKSYETDIIFLNSLVMEECHGVKIGDVLGGELKQFEGLDVLRQMKATFMRMKRVAGLNRFNYALEIKCEDAKNLVIGVSGRQDTYKKMYAVASCVDNVIIAREIKELNPDYHFRWDLLMQWYRDIKRGIKGLKKRLFCCFQLYWIWNYYNVLSVKLNLASTSVKNIIIHGEGDCVCVYLTERFQNDGFHTIGYQINNLSSLYPRAFMGAYDARLVWGEYSCDEAEALGVSPDNFFCVGLPSNIEREMMEPVIYKKKRVSLIVNHGRRKYNPVYEKEVEILQQFCKDNNLELRIKVHPLCDKSEYEKGLDNEIVNGVFGREYDSKRFLEESDILIVNNSTMLIEAYSMWKPCFQFVDENSGTATCFDHTDILKFRNESELQSLYDQIGTETFRKEMKRIHDYFVGEGNTRERYIEAFRKCGVI